MGGIPTAVLLASGVILAAGMLMAFVRLARGPSLPDRVVAFDALATMATGGLVIAALSTGQAVLLDIALAVALVSFLGTIALALSLEKGLFK
ncbi:MAG: monovalent cation/H+ antiporter complex subunit F [Terrimicrobiaceae bacterium]|nr:monovalent cation/H+ antiporter complex subunit F [Terrimicrobiaceae bacterium]